MKKILSIFAIILCMGVLLTGCDKAENKKEDNIKSNISGTSSEVLEKLVKKSAEYDKQEYNIGTMEVENHKITKDDTEDVLGLKEDEFNKYVEEATESRPVNSWETHSVVVVKLKDGTNMKEIAEKIIKNTAPDRFGCLKVAKIEGAYSGNYVIFASSNEETVDAVIKAFKDLTNNNMKVITRENNWNTSMFDE